MPSLEPFRCLYESCSITSYLLVNHMLTAIFNKLWEGRNVKINNVLDFSEVHEGMNRSGSLAKVQFARDSLQFIPS